MNNTAKRIFTAALMLGIAAAAWQVDWIKWLAGAVAAGMAIELFAAIARSKQKPPAWTLPLLAVGCALLIAAAMGVGANRDIVLILFLIIAAADTGAWLFGTLIGGDKMWASVSPGKTWSGQISGIVCGTLAGVLFALSIKGTFEPWLMWIGIGVSLLSQYGDLAASAIKRKLGIKDYSHLLPGHGGLLDRFDGWIFVLPIVWLAML